MIFRRKVKKGSQAGQSIGYPTINLNVGSFANHHKYGVYKSNVFINKKTYIGALYYGPKLMNKGDVVEIYIIDFKGHIYGKFIHFEVIKKIRDPKKFINLNDLKKQICIDLKNVI
ncbi:riboflavin kinase [Candidatus Peregrinibacteria bacterium]|nr:riboflavin kinase [Candidatus Peregrinibacteria bacterium]